MSCHCEGRAPLRVDGERVLGAGRLVALLVDPAWWEPAPRCRCCGGGADVLARCESCGGDTCLPCLAERIDITVLTAPQRRVA